MNINKHNYEAYFLDYHEKNLSPIQVAELMLFLNEHPDLKEEFENFQSISFAEPIDSISYDEKSELKKNNSALHAGNFEEAAIGLVEGVLSPAGEKELHMFVTKNPKYHTELQLYRKTKLVIDASVIYENKEELKKRKDRAFVWYYLAAATIAFLIAGYFLFNSGDGGAMKQEVATNQQIPTNTNRLPSIKNSIPTNTSSKSLNSSTSSATKINSSDSVARHFKHVQENKSADNLAAATKKDISKKTNSFTAKNETTPIPSELNPALKQPEEIAVVKEQNNDKQIASNQSEININHFSDEAAEPVELASVTKPVEERLTLPEKITSKVKTALLKEEMADENSYKEAKTKFTWYDAAQLTCKGLSKLTGRKLNVKKQYDDDSEVIAYQLNTENNTYTLPKKK